MGRRVPTWMIRWATIAVVVFVRCSAGAVDVHSYDVAISVGSVFQVPINVTPAEETLIAVQRAGNRVGVCCQYVNLSAHCSNDPQVFCLDNAQCGDGFCIGSCSENDFSFLLENGLKRVAWFAGLGNDFLRVPPVAEFPFVGVLRCSGVKAAKKTGEFECPCSDPCQVGACGSLP